MDGPASRRKVVLGIVSLGASRWPPQIVIRYPATAMANRSYLYACDTIPTRDADKSHRHMTGISEWNYDIPAAYKLLASGGPQICASSIWKKVDAPIAIVSNFDYGVRRLFQYLDRLPQRLVQPLCDEARRFLYSPRNRRKFFVLECGEIFDLLGGNLAEQNQGLLVELETFEPERVRSEEQVQALGLGNWSNVLYFDVRDDAGPNSAG